NYFGYITSVDYLKIDLFGVTVLYLVIVTSLCCCQCKIMHCQLKRNLTPCK
ncbi:membrane protein, partial [Salmonella enterica]